MSDTREYIWQGMTPEEQAAAARAYCQSEQSKKNGPTQKKPAGSAGTAGRTQRDAVRPVPPIPPYRPFPVAQLPVVLRDYVEAGAAAIGCDPALVALPALAVVAGSIGNSRALKVKRKWIEPALVWTVTIAGSGDRKSPGWSTAVDPLMASQMDLLDKHKEDVARYNEDLEAWKDKPRDERGDKPRPPGAPTSFITSDATIEAVGELLAANPKGLLLARDELDAWFQSFTRYKGKGGGTDRPHWLELQRAGTLRLDRLTRERKQLSVRRACCSVTGTIQPGILTRSLTDEALAAGLGARFLFAMPPAKQRRWTEAEVSEELAAKYEQLIAGLLGLTLEDAKKSKPHVLELEPTAKRVWVDWYNAWGERIASSESDQAASLAKLEGYALRLALIHQVVSQVAVDDTQLRPVGERSLRAGIALAEWFADEARRVYATLKEPAALRDRRRLIEWIIGRGGAVTVRDLQRANNRRWPDRATAKAELEVLVTEGLGKWEDVRPGPSGGHPTQRFRLWHPTHDTTDTTSEGSGGAKSPSDTTSDPTDFDPESEAEENDATSQDASVCAKPPEGSPAVVSVVSCVGCQSATPSCQEGEGLCRQVVSDGPPASPGPGGFVAPDCDPSVGDALDEFKNAP